MFVSTVKHQNRLNALLCLDKVGNMIQKVFAAIPIDYSVHCDVMVLCSDVCHLVK